MRFQNNSIKLCHPKRLKFKLGVVKYFRHMYKTFSKFIFLEHFNKKLFKKHNFLDHKFLLQLTGYLKSNLLLSSNMLFQY